VPDEVIYDAAVPPDRPSKPQRGLLIVMVTLMALALYIMYLIVSTALDKTVNSLSELKAKTGSKPAVNSRVCRNWRVRSRFPRTSCMPT
jgi:capsular polysaccharide biosynthesis protein